MSYILDALRRAEAERERGSVPGLHAQAVGAMQHAAGDAAGRSTGWMVPVLGVLVVAVAVLAWRPWAVDRPAGVSGSTPDAATPAAAPMRPAATPAGASPGGDARAPAAPTVEAPVSPARDSATQGAAAQRDGPPTAVVPRTATPIATAPVVAQRSARVATTPAPSATEPAAKRSVAPAASAAVVVQAASEPKVLTIGELPNDIRQQLPPLGIGGSIYSANPASRFLMINGQVVHEGDSVAPGLVLEQIRLKSAVLSFKGNRYGVTF